MSVQTAFFIAWAVGCISGVTAYPMLKIAAAELKEALQQEVEK